MNTDDESPLASIDLHAWRVPPPAPIDRSLLLGRALAPETVAPRSSRWGWLLVAIVVINAAIATLIVVLARHDPEPATTVALPAGGDTNARVRALLQQLEREQREIEERQRELDRKLAEIQQLHALVQELSKKVELYERTGRIPSTTTTPPVRTPPKRPTKIEPEIERLMLPSVSDPSIPDALDRHAIASTVQSIKSAIAACGQTWAAKDTAKARVRVLPDGSVANVVVDAGDNIELGECIANAIQSTRFPRTNNGGSFSYPFVF